MSRFAFLPALLCSPAEVFLLTEVQAHIAFNVLALHAGARPNLRESFVRYLTERESWHEFRFQGCLGFGGKLYRSGDGTRVDCYAEDTTPEREAVIARVNALLELL